MGMTSVLAQISQQLLSQTGDAHNFVLAVVAGAIVMLIGTILHHIIGHVLRVIVWLAAIGITVFIIYHGYHGTFRVPTHADVVRWTDQVRAWTGH